jgi:1,2-diacylglycerol 3-alpha-glucosyltransferase
MSGCFKPKQKHAMKIVHIAYVYVDGFNYQENELPKAHARLGHEVTLISTQNYTGAINKSHVNEPINGHSCYYLDGIKVLRLPLKYNIDYRFSVLKDLYKTLESEKPELIFFHGGAFLNLNTIASYVGTHPECKLSMDFHGEYYNTATNFISRAYNKYFFRFVIKSAFTKMNMAYYVTPLVGQFTKEMYRLPENKLKMLPLGFDPHTIDFENKELHRNLIRSKFNIKNEDIVVITGGRIEKEKNTVELVTAIKEIGLSNLHLIIFGNIVDKYKIELKAVTDDRPDIHFAGWLNSREVNNHYLASDIACFPGAQSVLWQHAIGCGLPICVKYFQGLEYLDIGGNVRFLYNDDVETIKSGLKEVIGNRELMESMAEVAQTKGCNYFSYMKIAQTVIDDMRDNF